MSKKLLQTAKPVKPSKEPKPQKPPEKAPVPEIVEVPVAPEAPTPKKRGRPKKVSQSKSPSPHTATQPQERPLEPKGPKNPNLTFGLKPLKEPVLPKNPALLVDNVAAAEQQKIIEMQLGRKPLNKYNAKSLDDLLKEKNSPYTHQTEHEYLAYIRNLNMTDLQDHSTKVGILPKSDRPQLERVLMAEFHARSSEYYGGGSQTLNPIKKKISAETLRILSEGR